MPLTELIIDGFKSFAQKTTIRFDNGITGIVGPNGSGKSNITEAIRWAMGESRAKSLRGNNMKDVIFAGSEFRKPLNSAEVTLVFSNKDHQLNYNTEQVSVTRRILRSGDNSYFINKQSVRLKDVRELFLDSGISQNSLAIISQGRVDQILNSRPEERRDIFEEAAGVLHFKQQKEIAGSQLEKTNDNLIRINDLVKELESRIEPLHKQSSLAKEYTFQKKGLDQKLKALLALEIQKLDQDKQKIKTKADKNTALLTKLDQEVKSSQKAASQKKEEFQQLQDQKNQVQDDLLATSKQISDINTQLQIAEQSHHFNDATSNEYEKQIFNLKEQVKALSGDLKKFNDQETEFKNKKSKLQAERTKLDQQLNEDPNKLNQDLEDERNAYIQILQDQTSVNNKLAYLNTELTRTKEDSSYHNDNVAQQLKRSKQQLEKLRLKGQSLTNKREKQQEEIAVVNQQVEELGMRENQLRQLVVDQRSQLQKLNARKEALLNIQKRHEGYYYGVRNILNHLDQYPGIIGAVGELITFPQDLEAAMTTALGGGVQDLIAENKTSARDAINLLKRRNAGRATFLPLDGLRQYQIPASTVTSLKSFAGFQGIASELLSSQTDIDISSAINYLLGSVIIVDTIETAMAISDRIRRYRIVTLDGDVISPGGSMTGGMKNRRNNSPLQTAGEINNLSAKIEQLSVSFKKDQASLEDINDKNQQATEKLTKLRNVYQQLSQEISEAALSFQNQEKEVKRLEDAQRLFNSRIEEHENRINQIKEKTQASEQRKKELEQKADVQKEKITELKARIENFSKLNEQIQAKIKRLDPNLAVYNNKLENLASQKEEKEANLQEAKGQLTSSISKLDSLNKNQKLSVVKRKELRQKEEVLLRQKNKIQAKLSSFASKLGQYDAQINQLDQVASRNYDLRKDAAIEAEEYSVKIAKFDSSINQKLSTLSEEYALTYEAAIKQVKIENNEENRQKLAKEVRLHRMSIEDIGPVNLDSIDEYQKVKERYDFLSGQQDDLLSAKEDLKQSMKRLDDEVEKRFTIAFKEISSSFAKIFPVVFGGGNAKLVLTDPHNMLQTGIEIIAQPPGKKLQRLSLLSGGERALTAITLLFAMLQVNPVPFCVLDEVEAALDDANVARFAQFLRKYDLHTQFIVITHRRGTMQEADQLFGVVMQELGVSKVVSVSLKDIKDEVN